MKRFIIAIIFLLTPVTASAAEMTVEEKISVCEFVGEIAKLVEVDRHLGKGPSEVLEALTDGLLPEGEDEAADFVRKMMQLVVVTVYQNPLMTTEEGVEMISNRSRAELQALCLENF